MSQETPMVEKHPNTKALEVLNQYDVEDFYACSISFGTVQMQGHCTKKLVEKYMTLGFVFEVTPNWLHGTKDNARVTLTYQH